MKKVKITKEQADAIEERKEKQHNAGIVRATIGRAWSEDYPLSKLDTDTVIRALYIGYEVETTYKVGDWVINKNTKRAIEVDEPKVDFLNKDYSHGKLFRHATPEEIAKEKERRWWEKHGRKVREYKAGDLFTDDTRSKEIFEITCVDLDGKYPINFKKIKSGLEDAYGRDAVLTIVCFVEDRKDV